MTIGIALTDEDTGAHVSLGMLQGPQVHAIPRVGDLIAHEATDKEQRSTERVFRVVQVVHRWQAMRNGWPGVEHFSAYVELRVRELKRLPGGGS
jgi:hypothetical protein